MYKVEMVNPERMEYRGYAGNIEYDKKTNLYYGNIIEPAMVDMHNYQGKTLYDLKEAFLQVVENHLEANV